MAYRDTRVEEIRRLVAGDQDGIDGRQARILLDDIDRLHEINDWHDRTSKGREKLLERTRQMLQARARDDEHPTTRDGVRITEGMKLWDGNGQGFTVEHIHMDAETENWAGNRPEESLARDGKVGVITWNKDYSCLAWWVCYSRRDIALAAMQKILAEQEPSP